VKRWGCILLPFTILAIVLLATKPWLPVQVGVVRQVLEGMASGRDCEAGIIRSVVDLSRIECVDTRFNGVSLGSRANGVWVTRKQASMTTALFGTPLRMLREDGRKMWLYQPKLDVTFAVDDRLLVDFAEGKITSDTLFSQPQDGKDHSIGARADTLGTFLEECQLRGPAMIERA